MFKLFILLISFFLINSANAQESLLTLKQQLDRLQRDVNDLSKSVFKDSDEIDYQNNTKSADTSNLTAFDLRIYDLEKDIKRLNESFEELIFEIDDLKKLYQEKILKNETQSINDNNQEILSTDIKIADKENKLNDDNSLGNLVINSEDLSNLSNNLIESTPVEKQATAEEEFQLAFDLIRNQKFDKAKEKLKNFIETYQDKKLSGSAHYWLGEIYLLKKDFREAALILAEGFQKYPKSVKAPDMLYKLSESLDKIGKKNDACNTLKKLTKEYSNYKLIPKVKNKILELNCITSTE